MLLRNYRKDGTPFWNEFRISPVHDERGRLVNFVGVQNDVTERKQGEEGLKRARDELEDRVRQRTARLAEANTRLQREIAERRELEEQLTHQAFHDPLTGLPNRTLFLDRLDFALERARTLEGEAAVLFVDLDDFQVVNDSLGHEAGDQVLLAVAGRLENCMLAEETLARFGETSSPSCSKTYPTRTPRRGWRSGSERRSGNPSFLRGARGSSPPASGSASAGEARSNRATCFETRT